jgi:hypothetical protein
MSGGYVIARENFKEAEKHVSAETNPVMFNLLYGLQSLTDQIERDFGALRDALAAPRAGAPKARAAKPGASGKAKQAAAPKKPKPAGAAKKARRSR